MRIYDPRVGRFLSVDPLTKSYPELTPYQFASNTPIQAIDLDGKEAWVAIWATQSKDTDGDGRPQIGHTGIVLENYEKISDQVGNAYYRATGTYTYCDFWPRASNMSGKAATKDVAPVYTKQAFHIDVQGKKAYGYTPLENFISNHDISQLPLMLQKGISENSLHGYGEGYAPDGIVKINLSAEETYNLQQQYESAIKTNKKYNAESNNCTSFVCKGLNNSGAANIKEEEIIDWKGILVNFSMDHHAYTPNHTYNQLKTAQNTVIVKDASNKTTESYEDAIIDHD